MTAQEFGGDMTVLYPLNRQVDNLNNVRLEKLESKEWNFKAYTLGNVENELKQMPVVQNLSLKVGAKIR